MFYFRLELGFIRDYVMQKRQTSTAYYISCPRKFHCVCSIKLTTSHLGRKRINHSIIQFFSMRQSMKQKSKSSCIHLASTWVYELVKLLHVGYGMEATFSLNDLWLIMGNCLWTSLLIELHSLFLGTFLIQGEIQRWMIQILFRAAHSPNSEFRRRYKHRTEKESKTKAWEDEIRINRSWKHLLAQPEEEKGTKTVYEIHGEYTFGPQKPSFTRLQP